MKLTVLGKYGPYPPAGGATSGYLLQHGGVNLLIECGSGILSRLQEHIPINSVSAIVLSHLHSDHICDMFVLNYALQQIKSRGEACVPLRVFAPDQPAKEIAALRSMNSFEFITLEPGMKLRLGEVEMSFYPMQHPFPGFGARITCAGKTLAYTGDTMLHKDLPAFAAGADLLLADAGLMAAEKASEFVPHLTARECGELAAEAGVKRLLLTHLSPRSGSGEMVRREAAAYYPQAEVAKEGGLYEI